MEDIDRLYRRRPLRSIDLMDRFAPWYDEWLAHPDRDAFWHAISPEEHTAQTDVAALNVGGWYDIFVEGTLRNFRRLCDAGREGQHLVVGPWSHSINNGIFPERHYGMVSGLGIQDPTTLHLEFYDRWLKGRPALADRDRPVRLFLMGANRWLAEADWPPPDVEVQEWHLRGDGRANTVRGDGRLSREPAGHEAPDAFLYDPRSPVPTIGGPTLNRGGTIGWSSGPFDQRALEHRQDVLVYTSEPLTRALDVVGTVEAVLHVSSSALDTDITAKLVDVHPDGRAEILTDGILRLRYRRSLSAPEPLEPGRLEEVRVLVGSTANRFLPGHRIRLDVSSSNFPRFDANTNSGGTIASDTWDDVVPAINRVFHDGAHPSRLLVPVIERD
jgi:putative CocE/NonD family hydrolase